MPALVLTRSSRLMPGLRAIPAVMITTIGILRIFIVGSTDDFGVDSLEPACFQHVKRFAFRRVFQLRDIDKHNIAKFFLR